MSDQPADARDAEALASELVEKAAEVVPGHDDRCESEFISGAMLWTSCACSERTARVVLTTVLPGVRRVVAEETAQAMAGRLLELCEEYDRLGGIGVPVYRLRATVLNALADSDEGG